MHGESIIISDLQLQQLHKNNSGFINQEPEGEKVMSPLIKLKFYVMTGMNYYIMWCVCMCCVIVKKSKRGACKHKVATVRRTTT